MSKKFEAAIFDLDGTLLNSEPGIGKSLDAMTVAMGLPSIDAGDRRKFIGPPIEESVRDHFGLSESQAAGAALAFRRIYVERYLFEAEPYEGVYEMLSALQESGIQLAIATNKRHHYATTVIEHFGFDKYLPIYLGSDVDVRPTKSSSISACLGALDVDARRSVYIGDTDSDRVGAASVDVNFIGVTYGFGFTHGSEPPVCAASPRGLVNLIV